MPISIVCPKCKTKSAAPDNAAGRKVQCPKCGVLLAIPSSAGITAKPPLPVASTAGAAPAKNNAAPVVHVHDNRSFAAHSLGIASLVLGCLTLVLSLVPCIGMLSLPLSVLPPVKGIKFLRLTLPASNFRGEGQLRIQIPASMFQEKKENVKPPEDEPKKDKEKIKPEEDPDVRDKTPPDKAPPYVSIPAAAAEWPVSEGALTRSVL